MTQHPAEPVSALDVVFPNGIPGFEDLRQYRLDHSETESGRVYRLRSLEAPDIGFTLVDPRFYSLNYVLQLTDDEQSLLQAETADEVIVLLMLWKDEVPERDAKPALHANIAGPILINVAKGLGMQKMIISPHLEVSISN